MSFSAINSSLVCNGHGFSEDQKMEKIASLSGRSICNHQKYKITFKQNSSSILCDVEKDHFFYSDIPLLIIETGSEFPSLNSPYSYTFDTQKKCILLMSYGLKGGMRGHRERKEGDEEFGRQVNLGWDIAGKVVSITVQIAMMVVIIFFRGGAGLARKFF
jgi:hypothetical protein